MMRKIVLLSFVFTCFIGKAQIPNDSVVMTVNGKQISLAEFEFIAKKNNGVDFSDEESLKEYVDLFKKFKLKVAEAEDYGLDKTNSFNREFARYNSELRASFTSDRKGEEAVARVIYDRGNEILELSQIIYPFDKGQCVTQDTVHAYNEAYKIYERIRKGENIDSVGIKLLHNHDHSAHAHHDHSNCEHPKNCNEEHCDHVHYVYQYISAYLPSRSYKALDNAVYSLPVGEVSLPIRTSQGFHIVKIHSKRHNPGTVKIAHIRIPFYAKDSIPRSKKETLKIAEKVYKKAMKGEDFITLINTYSADTVKGEGVFTFAPGELLKPIENATYALSSPGEISKPIETEYGYHIVQLVEVVGRKSFDEEKDGLINSMKINEWNFELFESYYEKLKKELDYVFYPEAYNELDKLCDEYFPSSKDFFTKAEDWEKVLVSVNGKDHLQQEFAYYLQRNPFSTKSYSKDFMNEVFDLFVRDLLRINEREILETKYPEINHLRQEYRDGILLFEISSKKIWEQPVAEQARLEEQWIKDLENKYPVEINWDVLKKLKNN